MKNKTERVLPWTWSSLENPWRCWCDRWWLHWLKFPLNLWWDFRCIWRRGTRGHGPGDVGDLNDYLCPLMLNSLERFKECNCAYPMAMTPEEWDAKLDLMIDGWKAMDEHLRDEDCPEDFDQRRAQREARMARWRLGMAEFVEHYESLWI